MKRFIPKKKSLSNYKNFIDPQKTKLNDICLNDYFQTVQKYELEIEEYFLNLFQKLGIFASKKSIRYSLPYKNEIINTQRRHGLICFAFNLQDFARQVVKELLAENVKKIRFYVIGDLIVEKNELNNRNSNTIIVKFRYTIH